MVRDQYRGLSEKEKDRKTEYTKNKYWKISEEDMEKLKELNISNSRYVSKGITTTSSTANRTVLKVI